MGWFGDFRELTCSCLHPHQSLCQGVERCQQHGIESLPDIHQLLPNASLLFGVEGWPVFAQEVFPSTHAAVMSSAQPAPKSKEELALLVKDLTNPFQCEAALVELSKRRCV